MSEEKTMFEQLKEYLDSATQEELDADWENLKKFNNIGPDIEELLIAQENIGIDDEDRNIAAEIYANYRNDTVYHTSLMMARIKNKQIQDLKIQFEKEKTKLLGDVYSFFIENKDDFLVPENIPESLKICHLNDMLVKLQKKLEPEKFKNEKK